MIVFHSTDDAEIAEHLATWAHLYDPLPARDKLFVQAYIRSGSFRTAALASGRDPGVVETMLQNCPCLRGPND